MHPRTLTRLPHSLPSAKPSTYLTYSHFCVHHPRPTLWQSIVARDQVTKGPAANELGSHWHRVAPGKLTALAEAPGAWSTASRSRTSLGGSARDGRMESAVEGAGLPDGGAVEEDLAPC